MIVSYARLTRVCTHWAHFTASESANPPWHHSHISVANRRDQSSAALPTNEMNVAGRGDDLPIHRSPRMKTEKIELSAHLGFLDARKLRSGAVIDVLATVA